VGSFVSEILNHLSAGGKAIDWPRIPWVTHSWFSCYVSDWGGSHNNQLAFEPNMEGVAASHVEVSIELVDQLHDYGMVVLHHVCPPLDV
jgi:hypothetical protein